MKPERVWIIRDGDGSNPRRVTLAQYRAELDERAVYARRVMTAFRANDLEGCARAQQDMRKRFTH